VKVILVDGYNVIRTTGCYAHLAGDDFSGGPGFNAAREALIADVAVAAQGEASATIVFDAYGNRESEGEAVDVAGIQVVFSPAGQTADTVIEQLARQARQRGDEVLVVTSDAQTQWTVMGEGVTRMSSAGFAREMERVNDSWREKNPEYRTRNTVAERIDPAVAAKLAAMVRPSASSGHDNAGHIG